MTEQSNAASWLPMYEVLLIVFVGLLSLWVFWFVKVWVMMPPVNMPALGEPEESRDPTQQHLATAAETSSGHAYSGVEVCDGGNLHQGDVYHTNTYHQYFSKSTPPTSRESDMFEKLIKSLKFDFIDQRVRNIESALPDTNSWLYATEKYQAWAGYRGPEKARSVFWIKGKPGSGKSTLMKSALTWTKRNCQQRIVIAYFFNARSSYSLNKSRLGLYRSIVHQAMFAIPASQSLLLDMFSTKERANGEIAAWCEVELHEFLVELMAYIPLSGLTIFVDALDEGELSDIRELVSALARLCMHARSVGADLRICLSSRHYPDISIDRGLCTELTLEINPAHHQAINTYIVAQLHGNEGKQLDRMRRHIFAKSKGIFLWVVLVVKRLNTIHDELGETSEIESCLDRIPEGLSNLFTDLLSKTSTSLDHDCLNLLRWGLFALRPLTAAELYLAVHSGRGLLADMEHKDDVIYRKYVLHRSRGLMELTIDKTPTVQFIHESVREYLLRGDVLETPVALRSLSAQGLSHDRMKSDCFQYIKYFLQKQPEWSLKLLGVIVESRKWKERRLATIKVATTLSEDFRLLFYAVCNMLNHSNMAQRQQIDQTEFLRSLLDSNASFFGAVIRLHNVLSAALKYDGYIEILAMPLPIGFLATQDHLALIAVALQNKLVDLNAGCDYRGNLVSGETHKPQHRVGQVVSEDAAACGNTRLLEMLWSFGSEIDLDWSYIFLAASRGQQETTIQMLADKGCWYPAELKI